MLLSFDPGADTGWALYDGYDRRGRLVACGLHLSRNTGPGTLPLANVTGECAILRVHAERPKLYPPGQNKVKPENLITLALRAGEVAGPYKRAGATVTYYEPWEWKGTISKDIHHARLWSKLDPKEQEIVSAAGRIVPQGKHHDMMDGIGIGLFAIGRCRVAGL